MGCNQLGFSDYELTTAKMQSKREKLLSEIDAVVPWQVLIAMIEPNYPKTSKKGGRPPYPLATMLRIHLLQQWYSLNDPAMEEAPIEVLTMRRFAGIELVSDRIPDETRILTFSHLLEKHGLGEHIFDTGKVHLSARGMTMRQGTGLPPVWWTGDRRNAMATRLTIDDHLNEPKPPSPAIHAAAEAGGCGPLPG